MKKILVILFLLSCSLLPSKGIEPLKAPVFKIAVFKNGVAAVFRKVKVKAGVEKVWADLQFEPVYGTLRVDTEDKYSLSTAEIDVMVKDHNFMNNNISAALSKFKGRTVTVYTGKQKVTGKVEMITKNHLFLTDPQSMEVISTKLITRFSSPGNSSEWKKFLKPVKKVKKRVAILKLRASKRDRYITVAYLTKGFDWAPNYKLEIKENRGQLIMDVVLKNRLETIENCKIYLVSGYPPIEYINSPSLFNTQSGLKKDMVFRSSQLNRSLGKAETSFAPPSTRVSTGGADLDFRYAGTYSVKKGEAIQMRLGHEETKVSSFVEWKVKGLFFSDGNSRIPLKPSMKDIWDYRVFRNPFNFPMTTAPLTIYHKGNFLSQQTVKWLPEGEEVEVRSSKTLNIQVISEEEEEVTKRRKVSIAKDTFRKSTIKGFYKLKNLRSSVQTVRIKSTIWGEIKKVSGKPAIKQMASGVNSINAENFLTWKLKLDPEEERTINFRYEILKRLKSPGRVFHQKNYSTPLKR